MPEPQMTPQIIMIPMQVAQWNLQIHPHHWSWRFHKPCSCEPYTTHTGHSTPILHELHLSGQGTAHAMASWWKTSSGTTFHTAVKFPSLWVPYLDDCTQDLSLDLEKVDPLRSNMDHTPLSGCHHLFSKYLHQEEVPWLKSYSLYFVS